MDQTEYTLTYWRGSTTNSALAEVVVAMNFDHEDHTWFVPYPAEGQWVREDLVSEGGILEMISEGGMTVTVPASSAILWTNDTRLSHVP